MEKFPNDFTIVQVTQDDGISDALVIPGQDAAIAIESGLEVRASRQWHGPNARSRRNRK